MNPTTNDPLRFLPLTPLTFHILVALAWGATHGYGIVKQVRDSSDGALNPGTGTFYSALHRMSEEGLIEESPVPARANSEDARRRYYAITRTGRAVLEAEANRLDRLVREARATRA